ncbi:hypothetical protein BC834DRAFT_58906 [Gloeopeniophorella convolvens]|nr:hypothetical protein BC834DRAFT_58906 [Gloeopeniophorella convolvens]
MPTATLTTSPAVPGPPFIPLKAPRPVLAVATPTPTPVPPHQNTAAALRPLYARAARAFLHHDIALTHSLLASAFALLPPPPTAAAPDPLAEHRRKWDVLRITLEATVYAAPPPPGGVPAPLRANALLSAAPLSLLRTRAPWISLHPPTAPRAIPPPCPRRCSLRLPSPLRKSAHRRRARHRRRVARVPHARAGRGRGVRESARGILPDAPSGARRVGICGAVPGVRDRAARRQPCAPRRVARCPSRTARRRRRRPHGPPRPRSPAPPRRATRRTPPCQPTRGRRRSAAPRWASRRSPPLRRPPRPRAPRLPSRDALLHARALRRLPPQRSRAPRPLRPAACSPCCAPRSGRTRALRRCSSCASCFPRSVRCCASSGARASRRQPKPR